MTLEDNGWCLVPPRVTNLTGHSSVPFYACAREPGHVILTGTIIQTGEAATVVKVDSTRSTCIPYQIHIHTKS